MPTSVLKGALGAGVTVPVQPIARKKLISEINYYALNRTSKSTHSVTRAYFSFVANPDCRGERAEMGD